MNTLPAVLILANVGKLLFCFVAVGLDMPNSMEHAYLINDFVANFCCKNVFKLQSNGSNMPQMYVL
jgi:hypothetical protein